MSKAEVMNYIRKEYNATILPHFTNHLKLYESKIYPVCQRKKLDKLVLPWEKIVSKDRTEFQFSVFGNKNSIDTLTLVEFDWQDQHCYAYIKHGLMVVFSQHALSRYAERVLESSLSFKRTFKILLKYVTYSYRTVLPSRTHPLSYYYVIMNALFLGEFDESEYSPYQSEGAIWLNTCISLKETGTSQKGILKTLSLIPFYIKEIGFNPFDTRENTTKKVFKIFESGGNKWGCIVCLAESIFLIDKLFVMMDLPVSQLIKDVFDSEMKHAGVVLRMAGRDTAKLSPYGKNGIAIRGELDYKEA